MNRWVKATYRAGRFTVASSLRPLRDGSRRFPEIPTRVTTPAVAALAYLDELAVATFPRVAGAEDPALLQRAEIHRVQALTAMADHAWDVDPAGFHADPPPPEDLVTEKCTAYGVRYD